MTLRPAGVIDPERLFATRQGNFAHRDANPVATVDVDLL
jgi:hypothetical protein